MPTAMMLMTVPLTIWSTRNEIESTACRLAMIIPDTTAASTPNQRLCVKKATA